MYNAERKQAFIECYYSKSVKTQKFITQVFNSFEKYEEEWQADLAVQNTKELQNAVNEISGLKSRSIKGVLIVLREYVKWCANNNFQTSNGIFEVRINSLDKIRTQMVSSPKHLACVLDKYFDKTEQHTIDIIYRVFLWMAYAGLEDKDAVRITSDDVDLNKMQINFEGHSYEIYKEGRADFEAACYLNSFFYEHPYYSKIRNRVEGNLIMRGFRSSNIDLMTIRPMLNRAFKNPKKLDEDKNDMMDVIKNTNYKISYKRIYLSGIFYRAYEVERMGVEYVDFSETVKREMDNYRKNKEYTSDTKKIEKQMAKDLREDYERWKCAF